jgi:hypothetical protein
VSVGVYTSPDFTPTESLIIDVLVARYRLGDTLWTFESRNMPALRKLEEKGLVHTTSGVTENTVRAWLSDKALRNHGASWFQLSVTMDHLADDEPVTEGTWSKRNLEQLAELPQQQCATDPRAINTAHVLLIQMINRRHPVHQILPGEDGGVVLKRGQDPRRPEPTAVRISADGQSFQLTRAGASDTTANLSDALFFTSRWAG